MEREAQAEEWLIQYMIDFILGHGAPKEILVSNGIVAAVLEQICTLTGITITQVKELSGIAGFMDTLGRS